MCYQQALKLKPNNAEVYSNQGISLHALKRYPEALSSYDQAILLKPDYATAYSNRGITLDKLKRYQDALDSYDQAIALNADLAEAYAHKSITLNTCQEKSAALANVNQAIALQPDLVEAYINRGIVLNDQKKFSESLNSFQQAIALRADYPEAFYNRAITYSDMHNFSEGLLNYQMAIALNPDYAEAYWNKALLKLMLGDFSEGWQLYEWRWQVADFPSKKREFQVPLWLGNSALTGKTILLHAEQGLGDSLQFCRYALLVADLAAKVLLEVPDALTYLLTSLSANISIIETGSALPTFDLHCPLMSLPLAFNTQLNSIPCQIPYLFAETEKLSYWRQYLSKKTLLRVGLVVSGSAGHGNDHNRSLPFAVFEPLLNFPISWHCLQKQIRNEDMVFLATHPEIKLYQDLLIDFSDTAALIMNMDLVISVDTAVAHLAGALGKPVWILLPHHADYRWLLDRSDSPWYPSARLFRQAQAGDSLAVITEVKTKLQSILQTNFA